ncbi:MAG: glycosyltransferase family 2 protein [Elusimicrobia bacterium]|nr:glycosyltransferase family 2 protein [Elusimicrobiota bacterium]
MIVEFTVIVPTYNRGRMLRSALETVRGQKLQDWECFVVDDGSTDETPRVIQSFSADARFRLIRSEKNEGMNASRNKALRLAQGRFVTFLDSDDLWLPERLFAFQERAQSSPEAGFLFSNAYLLRFGRIVGTLFDPKRDIPEGVVPGWYAIGESRLPYVTTNVAIRREAFERWGVFRTEMRTLDTELFARFLARGLPVAAVRRPLSVRRMHEGQLTVRYAENFKEGMIALDSSGAPENVRRDIREAAACEMALYLIKAGRPEEARPFLLETLGDKAKSRPEWKLSLAPRPILLALKALRALWLRLRYLPLFSPPDFQEALQAIAPLLDQEKVSH